MEIMLFEQFVEQEIITSSILRFLHEGVRVVNPHIVNESNLENYAQEEINALVLSAKKNGDTALIEEFVPEIMSLIKKFADSGQSGGSAPYTAGAIVSALKKLMMFQPLTDITGIDEEWAFGQFDDKTYQNKRCFSLFKEGSTGKPYYLDAIVWKTQEGHTWTGSAKTRDGKTFRSRQHVKDFPFVPKTFVIDVIEEEIAPDDWEFYIKDESQLEEVSKYYDMTDSLS